MSNEKDNLKLMPTPPVGAGGVLSPLDIANEQDLIKVLESSLYPGAKPESIRLVITYCRFNGHDPLKKPVHIVPMWVKMKIPNPSYREGTNSPKFVEQKVERDVLMPGVGLYRTDAARTGQYMGKSEPIYGPTIEGKFGAVTVNYPEWCKIIVKRKVGNDIVDFPAVEYWLENYATVGDSIAPNSMWKRRPFGQLAKCAEAQALRMAFPETVGSAPTAEEMEGKTIGEESLNELNAGHAAMLVDKTRERTEQLKRDMAVATSPTGDAAESPAIDVEARTVTTPSQPPEPPGDPTWTDTPPGAPTTVEPMLAPDRPLVLDDITFPAQLRSTGVKDRIRLPVYEQLQAEAKRLGVDLRAETEKLLGVIPDDLSNEAAKIFAQYLQARKA